jgi:hypothetical protein
MHAVPLGEQLAHASEDRAWLHVEQVPLIRIANGRLDEEILQAWLSSLPGRTASLDVESGTSVLEPLRRVGVKVMLLDPFRVLRTGLHQQVPLGDAVAGDERFGCDGYFDDPCRQFAPRLELQATRLG